MPNSSSSPSNIPPNVMQIKRVAKFTLGPTTTTTITTISTKATAATGEPLREPKGRPHSSRDKSNCNPQAAPITITNNNEPVPSHIQATTWCDMKVGGGGGSGRGGFALSRKINNFLRSSSGKLSQFLLHNNNDNNEKPPRCFALRNLLAPVTLPVWLALLLLLLQLIHATSGQLARPTLAQVMLLNGSGGSTRLLPTFLQSQQQPQPQLADAPKPTQSLDARLTGGSGTNLEAPPSMFQQYSQGPGVDLVALNRRRFELNHQHSSGGSSEEAMKRGELIESYVASLPDRLLASLPENMDRQTLLDSLAALDPGLLTGESWSSSSSAASLGAGSRVTEMAIDEPDGASIERLTKSCLSVHASSARPEQLNVTFHLYTKNNPHAPFIIRPQITRQELIKSSPLDPSRPIKWITHGFHTNVDKSEWMVEAKDKILAFEDSNVILTDWRRGASPALAFYPKAAANAHVVAKMIVKILRRLRNDIDFSRVHLIGHSLGAHIMGFVGSAFTEEYLYQKQQLLATAETGDELLASGDRGAPLAQAFWRDSSLAVSNTGQPVQQPLGSVAPLPADQLIGRITACDPALPCFGPTSSAPAANANSTMAMLTDSSPANGGNSGVYRSGGGDITASDWTPSMWTHLRPDSAVVVEVIHSNPGVMGYAEPLGDYDFYPNGLERQPGCGVSQPLPPEVTATSGKPSSVEEPREMGRAKRQFMPGFINSLLNRRISHGGAGSSNAGMMDQSSSRLSSTLDRFIKPIRDFFTGYTCSHHRAVEYMVESMYYERIPQDRKLDRDFVCQMVGYRCKDYASFKRGFCFKCLNELDCRAFTMSVGPIASSDWGQQPQQVSSSARSLQTLQQTMHVNKFKVNSSSIHHQELAASVIANDHQKHQQQRRQKLQSIPFKRVLPTFDQYHQNYLPLKKNLYFFDTRPSKEYCIHHYHLHVKYRWFRVRDSVTIDGFRLMGTLANITRLETETLNRFTYHSYTMLLTEAAFLGQVESLVVFGDKIKSMFVEYIEVSYMSNLDPRVRALGSARLCQQPTIGSGLGGAGNFLPHFGPPPVVAGQSPKQPSASHFVRCSGGSLVV